MVAPLSHFSPPPGSSPSPSPPPHPVLGSGFSLAMAGKISTLVLKVDLECHLCYKKIRRILCRLQDRENIKTISYNEKNNTVTISGPFDPQKLSKKLRCKAGKVIKDIQIIEEKPKDPPKESKPAEPAPAEKEKPKPPAKTEPEPEAKPKPKADPPPTKPEPKAEPAPKPKADPPAPKPEPPKTEPAKPKVEPDPPKPQPVPVHPPVCPACRGMAHYDGYYGGYRCWSCGRVHGWVADGPPMAYGGPFHQGYKPCHFFCEEDPSTSCTIM